MNFTVDDIEMFIEIGQIGIHPTPFDPTLWLHSGLNESQEVTEMSSVYILVLMFKLLSSYCTVHHLLLCL